MVIVEFFDRTDIENICAGLVLRPEKIILIGDSYKTVTRQAEHYSEILADKGVGTEIICKSANRNKILNTIELLSSIVEEYGEVSFDLTGGEDTYLTAAGIVFERYKDRNVQMHRFNLFCGTVQDCDLDGNVLAEKGPAEISVADNIRIYGGKVVYDDEKPCATHRWELDDDFRADINAMWEICREDPRAWNVQINVFAAAEAVGESGCNSIIAPVEKLRDYLGWTDGCSLLDEMLIKKLYIAGLIYIYEDDEKFSVTFKSSQVKKCLTKAGQALEMKVYLAALEASDRDGAAVYNDVVNGVYIDWDGDIHDGFEGHDTENEIDVMMMHGMAPVFVSCKNGKIGIDELYKLSVVAERFGGKYAKKVLVETSLGDSHFAMHFRERAAAMNIRIISGIQNMDDAEIERVVRSFWSN